MHLAVPPGVVSGYSALGLFSLKKAADAFLERFRKSNEASRLRMDKEEEAKELMEQREKDLKALREGFSMRVYSLKHFFEDEELPQNVELVEKLNKMHHADILSDEEFDKSLKRVIAHYRNLKFALSANELPARLGLPPAHVDNEEIDSAATDSEDD